MAVKWQSNGSQMPQYRTRTKGFVVHFVVTVESVSVSYVHRIYNDDSTVSRHFV
jgi:hypothetical protein